MNMGTPTLSLLVFALLCAAVALLLWPRSGLFARLGRAMRATDRVFAEDALKCLFHLEEAGREAGFAELSEALGQAEARVARAVGLLESLRLVERPRGRIVMTRAGREHAVHLIRAHRLWERFLADRTGVGPESWHDEAEQAEHRLTPAATRRLSDRMGHPLYDPHGDPIPEPDGSVPALEGRPLAEIAPGRTAEVVHVEDEPPATYARLLAEGFAPGLRLTVTGREGAGVAFLAGGRSHVLTVREAASVTVREVAGAPEEQEHPTLAQLGAQGAARVVAIAAACQGSQRRRLLDLGLVPGTEIAAEMSSALGDPVAYRVRGALIALRREQAEWILVERASSGSSN